MGSDIPDAGIIRWDERIAVFLSPRFITQVYYSIWIIKWDMFFRTRAQEQHADHTWIRWTMQAVFFCWICTPSRDSHP